MGALQMWHPCATFYSLQFTFYSLQFTVYHFTVGGSSTPES